MGDISADHSSDQLAPETIAALLDSALRAHRSGNTPAARALLRALSAQAPNTPRVWLALALVAETRQEQRRALERVLALEPQNAFARRGIARLDEAAPRLSSAQPAAKAEQNQSTGMASSPAIPSASAENTTTRRLAETSPAIGEPSAEYATTSPAPRVAPVLAPTEPADEERARAIRWPLYVVIGASLLVVLLAALFIRPAWLFGAGVATPQTAGATSAAADSTAALPSAGVATAVLDVTAALPPTPALAQPPPAGEAGAPTASAATALTEPTGDTATTPPTVAPPTPSPSEPSPPPGLAPGTVVQQGQWTAVLLRPDYVLRLDGSIGTFQPRGRFLLALVAVANEGSAPARLPEDLFAIVDRDGNRYQPLPAVSSAYLEVYGRGQRGDLSMEDMIPADGGNKSVPLIFDIPERARGLSLLVKGSSKGWWVGP